MKKIGRNEPCPCGSGKKYKKCCMGGGHRVEDRRLTDATTERVFSIFADNVGAIRLRFNEAMGEIVAAYQFLLRNWPSAIDERTRKLENHIGWVEERVKQILVKHSPLFWFSLERRFPAWLQLEFMDSLPGRETSLLRDTRRLMTALFLKYGDWEILDCTPAPDGRTLQIFPEGSDVTDLWGYLHPFFNEASNMEITYRCVAKGATLTLQENGLLKAAFGEDMERSAMLYDERRHKFSASLSPMGLGVAIRAVKAVGAKEESTGLFFLDINSDKELDFESEALPGKVRGPGFVPAVLLLDPMLSSLDPFAEKVEIASGLSPDELKLSFKALDTYIRHIFAGPGTYTCLQRGVIFAQKQAFADDLCFLLERTAGKSRARNITSRFLRLLTCDRQQLANYDILLRNWHGCLISQGEITLLDLLGLPAVLSTLLLDVALDDDMRNIKGEDFQDAVVDRLKQDLPGVSFPIPPGRHLQRKNEKQRYAEGDIYIGVNRFLAIVDCKAWSVTRGYYKGERKWVERRWEKVREWIRESDLRAAQIAANRRGQNYEIPTQLTHIVPIVCSVTPEFIWGRDKKYFLTETIPRVCTYDELVDFLRTLNGDALLDREFVAPIR